MVFDKEEGVKIRRKLWDRAHPAFANAGNSRNLHEKLKFYLRVAKHEEDDSTVTIRKYESMGNPVVSEVLAEIRRRAEEDDEIENEKPDPQEVRKARGKAVKKELQKTLDQRPDTLILLSRADLESEAELAANPARAFEKTPTQELLRTANKELKSVLQRSSRPKIEEDVVSEELDVEPITKEPTGRFEDVTGKPLPDPHKASMDDLNEEMKKAIERLAPSDNYLNAEFREKLKASVKRLEK